mmetsp:Transcript_21060/g.43915  ORF Transcript_21060/g.43915 Transcript_21060/m.43915 type:complete len:224 (-) Transcript_21060:625-1296(-)
MQSRSAELGHVREFGLDGLQHVLGEGGRDEYELRRVVFVRATALLVVASASSALHRHAHGAQLRTERFVDEQEVHLVQDERSNVSQIQSRILRPQYGRQSSGSRNEDVHGSRLQQTYLISNVGGMRPGGGGNERMEGPRGCFAAREVLAERGAHRVNLIGQFGGGSEDDDARTAGAFLLARRRSFAPLLVGLLGLVQLVQQREQVGQCLPRTGLIGHDGVLVA